MQSAVAAEVQKLTAKEGRSGEVDNAISDQMKKILEKAKQLADEQAKEDGNTQGTTVLLCLWGLLLIMLPLGALCMLYNAVSAVQCCQCSAMLSLLCNAGWRGGIMAVIVHPVMLP